MSQRNNLKVLSFIGLGLTVVGFLGVEVMVPAALTLSLLFTASAFIYGTVCGFVRPL